MAHLKTDHVVLLGKHLLKHVHAAPLTFVTERDFLPVAYLYLRDKFKNRVTPEYKSIGGFIDFRIGDTDGNTNPAVLELAVAPRQLRDSKNPDLKIPGLSLATAMYATANKSELIKLGQVPQSRAKRRYLLVVDLTNKYAESGRHRGDEGEIRTNEASSVSHGPWCRAPQRIFAAASVTTVGRWRKSARRLVGFKEPGRGVRRDLLAV